MDIGSIIGLVVGFAGILLGYIVEAKWDFTMLGALIQPTSAAIVFGGTFGATILAYPMSDIAKLPAAMKTIFTIKQHNAVDIVNQLAELSEKARKDGLLSLEQDAQSNENELIRKGLGLVVDGIETEVIKDILEREVQLHESLNESVIKIFESMGGFSPTMGVLGTVMGMVNILSDMGADTNELAHAISVAFIATMYGVMFANVVYLPFANRIKVKGEQQTMIDDLIIEGLLSIQAGENPKIIKEKLNLALLEKLSGKKGSEKADKAEVEG